MTKKSDYYYDEYEEIPNSSQNTQKQPTRTLFSIPLDGCLTLIILSAIAGIAINECKRSKLRLENDRQKYHQNDTTVTPNATAQNILFLKYLPRSY